MCGLAGILWNDPRAAPAPEVIRRMTDILAHRGPDDSGYYVSDYRTQAPYPDQPGIALGHRRLAIIDCQGSRQPLANEDETIWVVFNGEIYNYPDLRRRLEGSGHVLRTAGDTETLVHLYEDDGVDFLQHLVGMFALAIWDGRRRRLILARDRLGKKPLVYRAEADRLLFASELKSLLQAPGVPREIDPAALDEYLTYQYVPHPNTIFQGIRKLPPGHYAVWEEGRLTVAPYWQPDFNAERNISERDAVAELQTTLGEAVRERLRSDVPLGAFLSGGVDSSVVVALMQQASQRPVKTFSIGFAAREYDETKYARQVAAHLGTEHEELRVEPSAVAIFPRLVWHYDEPFADSSAIPTWYVSELTRQKVTVALTGDGGDELFGGYDRYRAVRFAGWLDRVPAPLRSLLLGAWWQRIPASGRQKSFLRRMQRFQAALGESAERRYANWLTIFHEAQRGALYSDEFLARLPGVDPLAFLSQAWRRSTKRDAVTQAMLTDLVTYLPCALMTKVDIASMAHSLECRAPFLDHRVVELAASLPVRYKLRGRESKWLLRQAFGHLLPAEIFRRRKMGFGVPLDHWFRAELKEFAHDVLLDARSLGRGYFRPEAVRRLLTEHVDGTFNHAPRLWALLFFELWQRTWIDAA